MKVEFTFQDKTIFDTYLENFDKFKMKPILEAIAKENTENFSKEKSYDDSGIAALKQSTIKRKGHSRVFYDTGTLVNKGIAVKELSKFSGEIYVIPERDKIVTYLAEGKSPLAGKRKGFGFSEQMKKRTTQQILDQLGRK